MRTFCTTDALFDIICTSSVRLFDFCSILAAFSSLFSLRSGLSEGGLGNREVTCPQGRGIWVWEVVCRIPTAASRQKYTHMGFVVYGEHMCEVEGPVWAADTPLSAPSSSSPSPSSSATPAVAAYVPPQLREQGVTGRARRHHPRSITSRDAHTSRQTGTQSRRTPTDRRRARGRAVEEDLFSERTALSLVNTVSPCWLALRHPGGPPGGLRCSGVSALADLSSENLHEGGSGEPPVWAQAR